MNSFVSVKAYDSAIVRITRDRLNEFNTLQEWIKEMLNRGNSMKEIKILIKEGVL